MKRRTPVQFPVFSFIFRAKLRVLASEENQIVSPLENHERVACSSTFENVLLTPPIHPSHPSGFRDHFHEGQMVRQARLQDVLVADHDLVLFMQARWADDIRTNDKQQHRALWHYINWLFKPEGQPVSVQIRDPERVNILTAMAENESVVKNQNDPERKAIALAWLFHLVGDIHQPLHTAQLFTIEYPQGDRGGNEICVRVTQSGQPMDLHRFWDGVITSSSNLTRLRHEATALRNRPEFQRSQLTELASTDFQAWANESFEIATKIAYRNGGRIGIPKGGAMATCVHALCFSLPM
jgi:hypothetical protein